MSKTSPFAFVNEINTGKRDLIRKADNPELMEKDYTPFIINRALSYFPDTIAFANEMNIRSHLPHIMQNDFFLNIIRKRKRFSKWHKTVNEKNLEMVAEYYGYNNIKAKDALNILTDADLKYIESQLYKGGIQKKKEKQK